MDFSRATGGGGHGKILTLDVFYRVCDSTQGLHQCGVAREQRACAQRHFEFASYAYNNLQLPVTSVACTLITCGIYSFLESRSCVLDGFMLIQRLLCYWFGRLTILQLQVVPFQEIFELCNHLLEEIVLPVWFLSLAEWMTSLDLLLKQILLPEILRKQKKLYCTNHNLSQLFWKDSF